MDVNAGSSPLQPANRDGGIDQDWAGDDQDWRDWYVTLAENDNAPIALVAGVPAARQEAVASFLQAAAGLRR